MNPNRELHQQAVVAFVTIVLALVSAFLLVAFISPNVSIDIPGISGCNGPCGPGGGD